MPVQRRRVTIQVWGGGQVSGDGIRTGRHRSFAERRALPRLLTTFLALALLGGCGATRREARLAAGFPPDACRNADSQKRVQALLQERSREGGRDADYTLASGDLLVVTIYNYRPEGGDFSSDVRVDDRGYISLPMIEPIRAAGMSLAEVRRHIVHALQRAEVLKEPLVSAFLKEYQGQQVVVLGAVTRPGMYSLSRGHQTLVDVLSMAGGLAPNAGNYVLFRPSSPDADVGSSALPAYALGTRKAGDSPGGDPSMVPICLDAVDGGTNPAILALSLRGGDLIMLPEAGQVYVQGEVDKPGHYPLTRGVTLTQMISSAGGPTFPADLSRVRLIRSAADGDSAEWQIDLDQINDREHADIRLERNDSIIVPSTPGRKVVYGMYEFVTAIVRITVGGAANIF